MATGPSNDPNHPGAEGVFLGYTRGGSSNGSDQAMVAGAPDSNAPTLSDASFTQVEVTLANGEDGATFVDPAVGADGKLYVAYHHIDNDNERGTTTRTIKFDVDADGLRGSGPGTGFRLNPIPVETAGLFVETTKVPAAPLRGISVGPVLDVDRTSGVLYLTYVKQHSPANFSSSNPDTDVMLAHSIDGGASWSSKPVEPYTDTDTAFLPWVDVDQRRGTVGVLYYKTDHVALNDYTQLRVRLAVSTDGGESFVTQTITPDQMTSDDSDGTGLNYREYNGLAVHDGSAYCLWSFRHEFDNPVPATDLDAFFAKVVIVQSNKVAARKVFYNHSAYDGNNAAANASDDGAIPLIKGALRPGEKALPGNYTSYSRGINGIMVGIAGLPTGVTPTSGDFEFKAGNTSDPSTWAAAPTPSTVAARRGAGVGSSDRVTLVWPDYDPANPNTTAVVNKWLRVTVKANANTGLTSPDVFYFGNLMGESYYDVVSGNFVVDALDSSATQQEATRQQTNPTTILVENQYDHNHDAAVNSADVSVATGNVNKTLIQLLAP